MRRWRRVEMRNNNLDDLKEDTLGGSIVLGVDGDLEIRAEYRKVLDTPTDHYIISRGEWGCVESNHDLGIQSPAS
jgi:hypothetical protein